MAVGKLRQDGQSALLFPHTHMGGNQHRNEGLVRGPGRVDKLMLEFYLHSHRKKISI